MSNTVTPAVPNMQSNTLMYVDILFVLPPRLQAYIRSAGSTGDSAFTELVAQHKAHACIEYTPPGNDTTQADGGSGNVHVAPVTFRNHSISWSDQCNYVAVVSQRYVERNRLHPHGVYPLMRLKYVGDGATKEIGNALHTSRAENSELARLTYTNMESVTKILDDFTIWFGDLKTLDLRAFVNVTSIGDSFLRGCCDLKTINISALTKVQSIGNNFLFSCHHLSEIDLSPFSNVVSIGASFMYACGHVSTVDLSPLGNIRIVPDGFLAYCAKLENIDLSPFRDVERVGSQFLRGCKAINPIDMSPLQNVTSIGAPFLDGVVSVTQGGALVPSPVIANYLATYVFPIAQPIANVVE